MRRVFISFLILLAIAGLGLNTYLKNVRPTPYLGAIPKCELCNVVLVSLDTLRADRAQQMPNLQKIAERSLNFPNAYANGYFTTPSHMTVFTSLFPATHRVETKVFADQIESTRKFSNFEVEPPVPLNSKYITFAELMQRNGYETFWNAPLNLRFLHPAYGFDRGFNHFASPPFARGLPLKYFPLEGFRASALGPLAGKSNAFIFLHTYIAHGPYIVYKNVEDFKSLNVPYNEDMLDYYAERVHEFPEFLLMHSFGKMPQKPLLDEILKVCTKFSDLRECFGNYTTPDGFWHAVGQFHHRKAKREVVDLGFGDVKKEKEMYRRSYTESAMELDRQIGQMWEELKRLEALDRTVVVFFSDHGEALLERGEIGHGSFFEEVARIPIIIYHPKLKEKIILPQLTSLVDLMPAVLEILGIPHPPQTQGRVPWVNPRDYVFGSTLGTEFITDGRYKLISGNVKAEMLFDLASDPQEEKNLLNSMWNPFARKIYRRLSEARAQASLEQSL